MTTKPSPTTKEQPLAVVSSLIAATAILASNGIKLRPYEDYGYETMHRDFNGKLCYAHFKTWMGACDHWAHYCNDETLYEICAATGVR